jgi:hypothetical protein
MPNIRYAVGTTAASAEEGAPGEHAFHPVSAVEDRRRGVMPSWFFRKPSSMTVIRPIGLGEAPRSWSVADGQIETRLELMTEADRTCDHVLIDFGTPGSLVMLPRGHLTDAGDPVRRAGLGLRSRRSFQVWSCPR